MWLAFKMEKVRLASVKSYDYYVTLNLKCLDYDVKPIFNCS